MRDHDSDYNADPPSTLTEIEPEEDEEGITRSRFVAYGATLVAAGMVGVEPILGAPPPSGGSMVVGLEGEPGSLLLLASPDSANVQVNHALFSRLIEGVDWKFNPRPGLADRWSLSRDGKTWTFDLNRNAKWHDGRPVTARDVVFSFEVMFARFSPFASVWWPSVESVRAVGPRRVVFRLKEPVAGLLFNVGGDPNSVAEIYPEHIYGPLNLTSVRDLQAHATNKRPIASGPYKFQEWVPGSHIVLVKNPDYYRKSKPYLNSLIFRIARDPNARAIAFESGEIDFLYSYNVPLQNLARYERDRRMRVIRGGLGIGPIEFLYMNTDPALNGHLSKLQVRRALAYAVNRPQLANRAMFHKAKVAHSIVSSVHPYYNGKYDVYSPNLARAASLLDAAGFRAGSGGNRLELRVTYRTGRDFEQRTAIILQQQLARVGIRLNIQPQDPLVYGAVVYEKRDFDLLIQLETTGPDPTKNINPHYRRANIGRRAGNPAGWSSAETEVIFAAEGSQTNVAKRKAMYDRVQRRVMSELPSLPLFEYPNVQLTRAEFRNTVTGAVDYEGSREDAFIRRT